MKSNAKVFNVDDTVDKDRDAFSQLHDQARSEMDSLSRQGVIKFLKESCPHLHWRLRYTESVVEKIVKGGYRSKAQLQELDEAVVRLRNVCEECCERFDEDEA